MYLNWLCINYTVRFAILCPMKTKTKTKTIHLFLHVLHLQHDIDVRHGLIGSLDCLSPCDWLEWLNRYSWLNQYSGFGFIQLKTVLLTRTNKLHRSSDRKAT